MKFKNHQNYLCRMINNFEAIVMCIIFSKDLPPLCHVDSLLSVLYNMFNIHHTTGRKKERKQHNMLFSVFFSTSCMVDKDEYDVIF